MKTIYLAAPMIVLAIGLASRAANITYLVNPVMLANDSEESPGFVDTALSGGFITTNGTIGILTAGDILDYRFIIENSTYPFTFAPANYGAAKSVFNIVATPTQIILPLDLDPTRNVPRFFWIFAGENGVPDCELCVQILSYHAGALPDLDSSTILYKYEDGFGGNASYFPPNFYRSFSCTPQRAIVIAETAEIPEPASILLSVLGLSTVANRCRRALREWPPAPHPNSDTVPATENFSTISLLLCHDL